MNRKILLKKSITSLNFLCDIFKMYSIFQYDIFFSQKNKKSSDIENKEIVE